MNEDSKRYDSVEDLFAAHKAKRMPPPAVCVLGYSEEKLKACACAAFSREGEAESLLREWFYANAFFKMDDWNKRTRAFFEDCDYEAELEANPPLSKDMAGPL